MAEPDPVRVRELAPAAAPAPDLDPRDAGLPRAGPAFSRCPAEALALSSGILTYEKKLSV